MSHKSPLQQRIVGGILAGLFEHVMDTVPELRALDRAARRGSEVPPSRTGRHIKNMAREIGDTFVEACSEAEKAAKKSMKRRGRKWSKATVEAPDEKPKHKAEDPDIIDLEKKPDGSYGAKS